MNARTLLVALALLVGCGERAAEPSAAAATATPAVDPAATAREERATRRRAADLEITRVEGELDTMRARTVEESAREAHGRRWVELQQELDLARIAREGIDVEEAVAACPERGAPILESWRATAERERAVRARWLEARLESVSADVALTDAETAEDPDDAAIARATTRRDEARDAQTEIFDEVAIEDDRRAALVTDAQRACVPGEDTNAAVDENRVVDEHLVHEQQADGDHTVDEDHASDEDRAVYGPE